MKIFRNKVTNFWGFDFLGINVEGPTLWGTIRVWWLFKRGRI